MKISKYWALVFFAVITQFSLAQKFTISGIVTDESGQSMPGVNVIVKGSKIGVMTNNTGFYAINLQKEKEIIVFSFVGFKSHEIEAKSNSILNVVLLENAISLN